MLRHSDIPGRNDRLQSNLEPARKRSVARLARAAVIAAALALLAQPAKAQFVTRSGSTLQLNGATFRFAGANAEWLGANGNTTAFQVQDTFAAMREMGQTVVRSLWLTSVNTSGTNSDALQISVGAYNDDAFRRADYVIAQAANYGLRVIVTLCDQDANGDGDYSFYTSARGLGASSFYTDPGVIGDFENFISVYLNHVNVFTGVANKDNPTILAWETGNELQNAPRDWTVTISDYISSIDQNHLIADGSCNFSGASCFFPTDHLDVPNVDLYTSHFYPMQTGALNDQGSAASAAGKAYFAGETDWANYDGGDSLGSFLGAVEGSGAVSGDLIWQIFGHRDRGGYQQYRYGGALGLALGFHYPGDTADMRTRAQQLRNHAYAMAGAGVPDPATPDTPVALAVSGSLLTWRGSANAGSYSIDRSTGGPDGPWTTICSQCTTDVTGFYVDTDQPGGAVWYRVRAFSLNGNGSEYSNAVKGQNGGISDPGFETVGVNGYATDPTGSPWTFISSSGISGNGSGYTSGNPNAPEGGQVAFLQGTAAFEQVITLPTNNYACIAFAGAQRGNFNSGGQDITIKIDNVTVDTIKPLEADYLLYTSAILNVQTPNHTLTIIGADSAGGDNTAFIDSVGIIPDCQPITVDRGF